MDDTKEVELQAEQQLTRRYWRLLGGISDAISRVAAAKVEAATLAVRLFGIDCVTVFIFAEYSAGRMCLTTRSYRRERPFALYAQEYHQRFPPEEIPFGFVRRVSPDRHVFPCFFFVFVANTSRVAFNT